MMNKLYEEVRLYVINKKISNVERERDRILSQRKVDMVLPYLMENVVATGEINKKLEKLQSKRNQLISKLNPAPIGKAIISHEQKISGKLNVKKLEVSYE